MTKSSQEIKTLENDLHLKQLQIKSLLAITQAINNNIPAAELFNMYRNFLGWEMGIQKMVLFIQANDKWESATSINVTEDIHHTAFIDSMLSFKRTERIDKNIGSPLNDFDFIIPVYHKADPISFVLIGDSDEGADFYNKIQFITTITNITAVAIENKRLFNQQIAQERLNREMELASEVQQLLIPDNPPKSEGFELASVYKPHFNIGGDYFDYIPLSKDKYLICIADISGKGIGAALLMSNFQAFLRSEAAHYTDLRTVVTRLNTTVQKTTNSNRFLTLFIMEYDLFSGRIKYVNAGHHAPILCKPCGVERLEEGTTIIGAMETLPHIDIGRATISEESVLFMFTDGLTDLKNEDGRYLNDDLIINFLTKHISSSPAQLNKQLLVYAENFKGDQPYPDDIAILTAKLCPVGVLHE